MQNQILNQYVIRAVLAVSLAVILININLLAAERIYVISHAGVGDPFWITEFKGAQAAARETSVQLTILAPETPNDINRQVELFRQALNEKPDGIAITLSDKHLFSRLLRQAKKRGIPVIAFNARPYQDQKNNNPYLAYIGMDDHLAGQVMAKKLLQSTNPGKHVVILNQQIGHLGLAARTAGIREIMEPAGIKVSELDITSNSNKAVSIIRNFISKHPDISTIISLGPIGTNAIRKLSSQLKPGVTIAAFDISPLTLKLIKQGKIRFTIDQQPYMQAYLAVKLLSLAARYKMTPPDINTGVGLVNRSNVNSVQNLVRQHIR